MAQNSAYTPLVNQSETITVTSSTSEPTFVELCMMRRAARWVTFIAVIQTLLGVFAILSGGFIFGVVSLLFTIFGFVGVAKKRVRLLTAHFAYSVALYILTLIAIIIMIVYTDAPFFAFLFLFTFLIFQAVGMKHSRILIGLLKMYPQLQNTCGRNRRCGANRCGQQQTNFQVVHPTEVATQTPVNLESGNIQGEQQQMAFYPIPMNAFPQYQQMPYRYPVYPMGPMMAPPMHMQPYMNMPAFQVQAPFPPQDNNDALYPGFRPQN